MKPIKPIFVNLLSCLTAYCLGKLLYQTDHR